MDNNCLVAWDLDPPAHAQLGLVSGGTSDLFTGSTHGENSACVLRLYAARHGYGLYVERNLSRWADRRVAAWGAAQRRVAARRPQTKTSGNADQASMAGRQVMMLPLSMYVMDEIKTIS